MKRMLIQKPEPLLLVVPLLLFLLNKLFTAESVSTGNQLTIVDSSILFWYGFVSVLVPVLLHFFLRTSRRWNPAVCRPHVYATIVLSLLLFFSFYNADNSISPVFFERISSNLGNYFQAGSTISWLLLFGLLLQIVFFGYFLVRIFRRD